MVLSCPACKQVELPDTLLLKKVDADRVRNVETTRLSELTNSIGCDDVDVAVSVLLRS